MFNQSCIFCKIIQKQIKSHIVKENDFVIAVNDIEPKAPTHILLIPKKHIINIDDLKDGDDQYVFHFFKMAQDLSKDICNNRGFNLIVNNGADAGQSVFHLHIHFISGKNIYDGGLSL